VSAPASRVRVRATTVVSAAAYLAVSKRTLSRLIARRKIVARKDGVRTLVDVASLKERKSRTTAPPRQPARRTSHIVASSCSSRKSARLAPSFCRGNVGNHIKAYSTTNVRVPAA
jgi:excisionase family DNA binding protein